MVDFKTMSVEEPMDLVKLSLNEVVYVKCRHGRELKGKLHGFDTHFNLLLEGVEEFHTYEVLDPISNKAETKCDKRKMNILYVRGDTVILVSPISRKK